jgi:hypothetical protein
VRPPSTPTPPRLTRSRSIPTVRFLAPLTRPPTSRPLPFRLRLPHSPPKPKPCGCLPLHRASAAAATRMLARPPASQPVSLLRVSSPTLNTPFDPAVATRHRLQRAPSSPIVSCGLSWRRYRVFRGLSRCCCDISYRCRLLLRAIRGTPVPLHVLPLHAMPPPT